MFVVCSLSNSMINNYNSDRKHMFNRRAQTGRTVYKTRNRHSVPESQSIGTRNPTIKNRHFNGIRHRGVYCAHFCVSLQSACRLLSTWVVLYFNLRYRGILTVKVVNRCEDRLASELKFLYVFLLVKLSQY